MNKKWKREIYQEKRYSDFLNPKKTRIGKTLVTAFLLFICFVGCLPFTVIAGKLTDKVHVNLCMFRENIIMVRFEGEKTVQQVKKEVIIRGVVKDKHGESLPGVSVWLKGTTVGVATDVKGEFRLTVPMQDTIILRFTFIGMKPKDVVYDEKIKSMLVILEDNVTEMDEVVVTGYQEIKKERMTGAVEMITAKDIVNKGYTSVEEILKGTLAGVTTMSLSGRPGAQAEIRIRGVNSLTGSSDPMWIVDGMPLQGDVPEISMGGTEFQKTVLTSGIGNISPDDIESITVLKDAAATAVYGSRAANGVIVITTKRGTVGLILIYKFLMQ